MDLEQAKSAGKMWLRRIIIGGGLLTVLVTVLYVLVTLNFSYSRGGRVGFVQKLSKRGWVCKTTEGELAMVNIPGQPAQMFAFSVRDDEVAKKIDALAGHQVELEYEEHRGIPSSCFGESQYFVVGARKTD